MRYKVDRLTDYTSRVYKCKITCCVKEEEYWILIHKSSFLSHYMHTHTYIEIHERCMWAIMCADVIVYAWELVSFVSFSVDYDDDDGDAEQEYNKFNKQQPDVHDTTASDDDDHA